MKKLSILISIIVLSCGSGGESPKDRVQTISKSVLMVIAPTDFQDDEFRTPYDSLTKAGVDVTVASTDTTPAKGMFGMVVKPDVMLEQVRVDDYDALVVVGGSGCEILWDNGVLHEIVRHFDSQDKLIAAICLAPITLGRAGILVDKIVTAHPAVRDEIGKCCMRCTEAQIEISGNIITCSGPKSSASFASAILNALSK